jgi:hypothetical protein
VARVHHLPVRRPSRRLAFLVLVLAVGSCELPKPPIPQLPAGQVDAASGRMAGGPRDPGHGAIARSIAAVLPAVPR